MYRVRLTEENDLPALIDFFKKVYKPGHIMTDREYLKWQFPGYSNLLLEKDSELVGHLGLIPYKFRVREKLFNAAFLGCLIVSESLRSHGAGVLLTREAEKYFDILYTTGFSPPSAPVFKFCGWSNEALMTRWVKGLKENRRFAEDADITTIDRFGPEWEKSWKMLGRDYAATIDRSAAYLNWRFIDNPKIKYHIFGLKDGYIILRIEKGDEFTAGRIVDLIGGPEAVTRLVKRAVNFAGDAKADFIDFFSFPSKYDEAFQETGFHVYNHKVSMEPPIFILPVDRKRLTLNFSYKFVNRLDPETPLDWFVVKADGDRDRAY